MKIHSLQVHAYTDGIGPLVEIRKSGIMNVRIAEARIYDNSVVLKWDLNYGQTLGQVFEHLEDFYERLKTGGFDPMYKDHDPRVRITRADKTDVLEITGHKLDILEKVGETPEFCRIRANTEFANFGIENQNRKPCTQYNSTAFVSAQQDISEPAAELFEKTCRFHVKMPVKDILPSFKMVFAYARS